jgi:thiol-disulfide isomerase/thioredoxin
MAKKIAIITLILVIIFSFIIGKRVLEKSEKITSAKEKVEKPEQISYLTLDSIKHHLTDLDFPMILVLVSSDCEHCRYEINTFLSNGASLEGYNVLFLSTEKIPIITRFRSETTNDLYPWAQFGKITNEDMLDTFGTLVTPQIYIYNDKKNLVKYFKGETKFEAILKFL